jgi:tetrahydromethanopterin S-methyltransferase subunit G
MSGEPENLILVFLRAMRSDINEMQADIREVKQRLTSLEIQIGGLVAAEQTHFGHAIQRFDRHEVRLDRIERRLDIVPA